MKSKPFSLLALLIPVILGFSLMNLSYSLLKKTPLYDPPLRIIRTWATRSLRSIRGADLDRENIIKFPITVKGMTFNIIAELSRKPKDGREEKAVAGEILWASSKGAYKQEMVREMIRSAGHERLISVKEGNLSSAGNRANLILIFAITLSCLTLYLPIFKKIQKQIKEN
jgi:hypothetical protein